MLFTSQKRNLLVIKSRLVTTPTLLNLTRIIMEKLSVLDKLTFAPTLVGHSIFLELLKIRSSYLIFLDNKVDLDRELKSFEIYFSKVHATEKETRNRQRTLMKCFFNLLTSAQSLKEQLLLKQSNFCLGSDGQVMLYFFRELRNLIVHNVSLPLISMRRLVTVNDDRLLKVEQIIDKDVFIVFLKSKIERLGKTGNTKQQSQVEKVIKFVNDIPDDAVFSTLLADYNQSRIDFYRGWVKSFVKCNSKPLLEFNDIVKEIHTEQIDMRGNIITNLPINIFQSRWLRMWLSYSTIK